MPAKRNNLFTDDKGQAMVETLISTVFLIVITFAALQLVIMVVNDLTMNEAAFAVSRVDVVSKETDVQSKNLETAGLLFATQMLTTKDNILIPYDIPVKYKEIQGARSGTTVQVYMTTIQYIQGIMFGYLFSGPQILSIGNINVLKCASRARMVKSPDEKYYDKAYPNAPAFRDY